MMKEFREFVMRGNVLDMAVGIIIGAAFGTIVKSLVADIIMPPIGLLLGKVDFNNLYILLKQGAEPVAKGVPLANAQAAGAVTINYGVFINTVIAFLIIAFVVFLMVRQVNRLKRKPEVSPAEPTEKDCPFCLSKIPVKARRCPHCTSQLEGAGT